jgi:poly-gamma-glutamate capsule biosynthesis protein CapA/YwtB (metallophosphatase superfamily)
LAIVNLEVPLAGKPYSGYPQFSSPDELASNLKETGFDVLVNANNHALDRGKDGLVRTLNILDSVKVYRTGTFRDTTDKNINHPLIIDQNNIRIGLLNYTYGTNGFVPQKPVIVNYIDTALIRSDIAKCKQRRTDFIIVVLHWGVEYERHQIAEQETLARFIRNCGANAILGSHPHVVEPFEKLMDLKDTSAYIPVIYSVGNFVSNQRDRYRDGGIVFELNLQKTRSTKVLSCKYLPVWVFRGNINGREDYRLIPPQALEKSITDLKLSGANREKCEQFFEDTRSLLNNLEEAKLK